MICQIEGKKKQLDIAQVKEVLKILIDYDDISNELGLLITKSRAKNLLKALKNAAIKQKALAKNKTKRKKQ